MEHAPSVDDLTEKILAILLIRIIALLSIQNLTPALPDFADLSTATICHSILHYKPSPVKHDLEDGENEEGSDTRDNDNDLTLRWPENITETLIAQLHKYIHKILSGYRVVPYHNSEHAYHVFISAHKLLDLVLCEYDYSLKVSNQPIEKPTRPTFGLKKDPLLHLAFLFSALVHDVDHTGVSNRQLVLESDELALMYNDQSCAEQRSLAIAFSLLMNKDYQALRSVIFQKDDYQRFRKVVIDLVLCTDIASPERVQIVKSKWKECFIDKHKTLSPKLKFPNIPNHKEVNISRHSIGGRSSIGFDEAPTRRNGCIQSHSDRSNLVDGESAARRVSIVLPDSGDGHDHGKEKKNKRINRSSLLVSQGKKKNSWRFRPANIDNRGNKLLRSFFLHRSSQLVSMNDDLSISDDESPSDTVEKKKKFRNVLNIFKRKKKRTSGESSRSGNQEHELEQESRENIAPLRSSAATGTTAPSEGLQSSEKNINGHTDLRSSDNLGSISGILDQYEDDISEASSNATSINGIINQESDELYQSKSNSMSHAPESSKRSQKSLVSTDESASSSKGKTTRRNSFKKLYRRFTEPPNQISDRKKFQFRLGIRRALDLTGNQIDAYAKANEARKNDDPDQPDEMKVIVILEQLMKAADVAANMQNWDTMVTWCKRLFQEQKVSSEAS